MRTALTKTTYCPLDLSTGRLAPGFGIEIGDPDAWAEAHPSDGQYRCCSVSAKFSPFSLTPPIHPVAATVEG